MCQPTVSVVIAVYNSAATLVQAVESARQQTLGAVEIIAYDDCSTDQSLTILHELAAEEPRLRIIPGTQNLGPAGARNRAIDAASGDWITILDSDDWMLPDRLERLVAAATQHNLDVIYDNQLLYDTAAAGMVGYAVKPSDQLVELSLQTFLANSITGWSQYDYGLFQPTLRRKFLVNGGIKYPETMRYGEDFIFQLSCFTARGKCGLLHKPLYVVRQPIGSRSGMLSISNRKPYDFENMIAGTRDALNHLKNLHPAERRLLELRIRSINNYNRYLKIKSLKSRSVALLELSRDPLLWRYAARAILRRLPS